MNTKELSVGVRTLKTTLTTEIPKNIKHIKNIIGATAAISAATLTGCTPGLTSAKPMFSDTSCEWILYHDAQCNVNTPYRVWGVMNSNHSPDFMMSDEVYLIRHFETTYLGHIDLPVVQILREYYGHDVQKFQHMISEMKYNPNSHEGVTYEQIGIYLRNHGVKYIGNSLILEPEITLQVLEQWELNDHDFQMFIKEFQRSHGLSSVDGIIGNELAKNIEFIELIFDF